MKILCIDPGIYNLAYIFADDDRIIHWGKYSLISGSTCDNCTDRSSCIITTWTSDTEQKQNLCKKHLTAFRKTQQLTKHEITEKIYKKIMNANNPSLKTPISIRNAEKKSIKEFDTFMTTNYPTLYSAMKAPGSSIKVPSTFREIMQYIHQTHYLNSPSIKSRDIYSIEFLHEKLWEFINFTSDFATADIVYIENQPVMKNPVMKNIQNILFTLFFAFGKFPGNHISTVASGAGRESDIDNKHKIRIELMHAKTKVTFAESYSKSTKSEKIKPKIITLDDDDNDDIAIENNEKSPIKTAGKYKERKNVTVDYVQN
jgi:predicted RNA-binding protein with RPS1 domain